MQSSQINWREPDTFAAGDTLNFQRFLRDYLPQNGWSLLYEILGNTKAEAIQFVSVAGNDDHKICVLPAVTQQWLQGQYVLAGYVVNQDGNRHQIYYGQLEIFPNGGAGGQDNQSVTTHAQRMIPVLEAELEKLAMHSIEASNVQQTQFIRIKRLDLEEQLARNKHIRMGEIAQENIRNGKPSGNTIVSQFRIIDSGSSRAVNPTGNLIP